MLHLFPVEAAEVADEGRARLAYQRLFGDSLGLDGGDPMPWKDFSERALVAQALPMSNRMFVNNGPVAFVGDGLAQTRVGLFWTINGCEIFCPVIR